MYSLFDKITNCVDDKGKVISGEQDIKANIEAAEELCQRLLGCTLDIRGRQFILRMLEIYYGGIGDDAHDWYRTRFVYKTSKYIEQTSVQTQSGFRVYLSSMDVEDTYTRMDIVAGNSGVPISFLIRSMWDSSFNLIGSNRGNPNIVLNAMAMKGNDHGKIIELDNKDSELFLIDSHKQILKDKGLKVVRRRRVNLKSGFEEKHQIAWNFCLE